MSNLFKLWQIAQYAGLDLQSFVSFLRTSKYFGKMFFCKLDDFLKKYTLEKYSMKFIKSLSKIIQPFKVPFIQFEAISKKSKNSQTYDLLSDQLLFSNQNECIKPLPKNVSELIIHFHFTHSINENVWKILLSNCVVKTITIIMKFEDGVQRLVMKSKIPFRKLQQTNFMPPFISCPIAEKVKFFKITKTKRFSEKMNPHAVMEVFQVVNFPQASKNQRVVAKTENNVFICYNKESL